MKNIDPELEMEYETEFLFI